MWNRSCAPRLSDRWGRAALGWLLVSGLLLLEPLHLRAVGEGFSHAYIGAIRHAVTVGFISQMIVGVSTRVAPRPRCRAEMPGGAAWVVFVLLNVGNTLRVGCEIVTDYTPGAFRLMGVTGFVELTALLVWGANLAAVLIGRDEGRRTSHGPLRAAGR